MINDGFSIIWGKTSSLNLLGRDPSSRQRTGVFRGICTPFQGSPRQLSLQQTREQRSRGLEKGDRGQDGLGK